MKKKTGTERAVVHIPASALRTMPTKALLARLASLRMCEESLAASDLRADEVTSVRGILFKATPEWVEAYSQVKKELSTREHVA